MAKKKFYVVWRGRETGIFTDWPRCQRSVEKFPDARYKSFPSRAEAEAAFKGGNPGRAAYASRPAVKKTAAAAASTPAAGDFQMQVYCDGGCEPNPGEAGSGMAVYRDGNLSELWYGLYNPQGTNNTAELNALYQSLKVAAAAVDQGVSVQVLCDSMYSLNCISQWAKGWKAKGWTRAGGEIKNLEIIQQAYQLYTTIEGRFSLVHVKAHAGTEGNELADRMSILAVDRTERDFVRLPEPLDIESLLRLRAG